MSAWKANGASIVDLFHRAYILNENQFYDSDVAVLRDTASRMLGALSYIDSALRQGIVGYAVANIEDEKTFQSLRINVENTLIPLSMIIDAVPVNLSTFSKRVTIVENGKLEIQRIIYACDVMRGNNYTWAQISPILNRIINEDEAYLGPVKLSALTTSSKLLEDNTLTLTSNAGVMAKIADFCGNYNVIFSYSDNSIVEVVTNSTISSPYLSQISKTLEECTAAAGDKTLKDAPLNDIYGYVIDLAFR